MVFGSYESFNTFKLSLNFEYYRVKMQKDKKGQKDLSGSQQQAKDKYLTNNDGSFTGSINYHIRFNRVMAMENLHGKLLEDLCHALSYIMVEFRMLFIPKKGKINLNTLKNYRLISPLSFSLITFENS